MGGAGGVVLNASCSDTPPAGAPKPPPPPVYAGTCPTLQPGTNSFQSGGTTREFMVVVPSDIMLGERLPVLFLWHWLGGSAKGFLEQGEVQAAVDQQRFIAVIPEALDVSTNLFKWPYSIVDSQARVDQELKFFDDMLACVSEQFAVNENCVSSIGVSAGALWTDQLVGARGDYLSSFVSLSGGVGGQFIKPWKQPNRRVPGLVLWGGSNDTCVVINFQQVSQNLENELINGGHFFLECVHNCGHAVPPFEPPMGFSKFKAMWQFVFDHPYWLRPGQSPYNASGVPAEMPAWCGIGKGGATPRTGMCEAGPGCN